MPYIEVNGEKVHYNIAPYNARQSIACYRRKIVDAFDKIGITAQYLDIRFWGGSGYRESAGAEVTWLVNNQEHKYTCTSQSRDVDNLAAIAQIIDVDCRAIRRGLKSFGQVMNQFRLDYQPDGPTVRSPREIMGVPADMKDLEYIKFKYKQRAKELHSDSGGSDEAMQELNKAFEQIKEETTNPR